MTARPVRPIRFARRSTFPVSAACLIANAVRETLARLLEWPVSVRLSEPLVPAPDAWAVLLQDAGIYNAAGSAAAGAFVLRAPDALCLAAAAFGEAAPAEQRMLSRYEREVVGRALRALFPALAAGCGPDVKAVDRVDAGFLTYFDLCITAGTAFRLGVALGAQAPARTGARLRIEDLLDVRVEVRAELAQGEMAALQLMDLRPGAMVPMNTKIGEDGRLLLAGAVLARGICGASGERHALVVK